MEGSSRTVSKKEYYGKLRSAQEARPVSDGQYDDAHRDPPRLPTMAGTATFVLQCLCGVPEGNRSSFEERYCWVRYLGESEEELLTERSIQRLLSARYVWLVGNAGSYGRGSASNGIDK